MIDTIAITDATPITMPSVVRKLRNACAWIEPSAARAPSVAANQMDTRPRPRFPESARAAVLVAEGTLRLLRVVLDDLAVLEPDHAAAVLRDVGLVRHEHDRLAVRVQLVEQRKDLGRRLRVEIAGR